jgi:hypothetical protein
MPFKRGTQTSARPRGDALTQAMTSVGMNFASSAAVDADIEATIVAASEEGLEHDDLRTLAVLTTWLEVHAEAINADRLIKIVSTIESPRTRAFWSAFASRRRGDRRFHRLKGLYTGPRLDLLRVGTGFQLRRHGEDPRFADTALRVPANVLRDRPADVLDPGRLARTHTPYRLRLLLGPSYRADMWAALERDPTLSAAELARQADGSFATAWQVKAHWSLLGGLQGALGSANRRPKRGRTP